MDLVEYKLNILPKAFDDIKNASNWYEGQLFGLGERFEKQVKLQINSLKNNPDRLRVRYKKVRCLLIKGFPFLIHFTTDSQRNFVNIFAVYHTSRNPKVWNK